MQTANHKSIALDFFKLISEASSPLPLRRRQDNGVLGPAAMVLILMTWLLNRIAGQNEPHRAPTGGTTPPG